VGDRVWWQENEPETTLSNKRTGPYRIAEALSPLNYKLEEVSGGPKIGRRHPVVHIKQIEEFAQDWKMPEEEEVEAIIKHERRKKKIRYRVKWADGFETWERASNLIDKGDGEPVINDALLAYWAKKKERTDLRKEEGY